MEYPCRESNSRPLEAQQRMSAVCVLPLRQHQRRDARRVAERAAVAPRRRLLDQLVQRGSVEHEQLVRAPSSSGYVLVWLWVRIRSASSGDVDVLKVSV